MALTCYAFIILLSFLNAIVAAHESAPVDVFGTGVAEWHLAFRGTAFNQQSVFDAYVHGSEYVDPNCKQTMDASLPCHSHYRSSILNNWEYIDEVAFLIYKNGIVQKHAIFDGSTSNNMNWFSASNLKSSSWSDLTGEPQFFSISGHECVERRFFINHNYGGCDNDAGWFVAVDTENPPCQWEKDQGFPLFLYATEDTNENWTHGKLAQADFIAVYVKYQVIEKPEFVNEFGVDEPEWWLAFRGTSHINQSVYEAYLHGSENVDVACKQINGDIPCSSHYRSSILDDWTDIAEVALVLYKSGQVQKSLRFDGTGTDNQNWLSSEKLIESSWTDLKTEPHNFFSIDGDHTVTRRFFINRNYGGCPNDKGWFVAKDQSNDPCEWEKITSYPVFWYANSETGENWTTGQIAEADVIAVFVKYG